MVSLSDHERAVLSGQSGTKGDQMAMEIVVQTAKMFGAERLVTISSSHIDGCLYHGDSGVLFCEALANNGAKVTVPSTTNVGALNLLKPGQSRLSPEQTRMAYRLMMAHEKMGCASSWTCAPYQAGARPKLGQQVAWGESNAVAFTNTVLGARTNRYGDFLDIACAISGRAPYYGLHKSENRLAKLHIDVSGVSRRLVADDAFYPVLGAMIGRLAGETVAAVDGLAPTATDDQLKALCAGAASTGAVGLVHLVGLTPEAPDLQTALGGIVPEDVVSVTHDMVVEARNKLSQVQPGMSAQPIDCVALGSPHFSADECRNVLRLAKEETFKVPFYICIGRHTLASLQADGADDALQQLGVEFVIDTCVVVTPIFAEVPAGTTGVMMTNSAKFAHYAMGNTGYASVFGSLADCVASGQAGTVLWDRGIWGREDGE